MATRQTCQTPATLLATDACTMQAPYAADEESQGFREELGAVG